MTVVDTLPDLHIGIFATVTELNGVTSVVARQGSARRAALQHQLLRKFPNVTTEEFRRMLLKCPRCEHAISVGKFLQTQHCTQCGYSIINPDGMFYLALKGMLRLSKTPMRDFIDFLQEIPRV